MVGRPWDKLYVVITPRTIVCHCTTILKKQVINKPNIFNKKEEYNDNDFQRKAVTFI
jgi:hypothetical protein